VNKNARERGESEFGNELTVVIVRVILIGIINGFVKANPKIHYVRAMPTILLNSLVYT
jgi:hypothetical protein